MLHRLEAKLIKIYQSLTYFLLWSTFFSVILLFFRIRLEGKENIPKRGRFILAANHQNFFDGFLLAYPTGPTKRVSFVIAKRALKLKFSQILARMIGSVMISNGIEEYQRALKKLNRVLSHGGRVGIFPEGDVSNHGLPRKFKGGVAKLSLDSNTKVVPVYLGGTYNLRCFKYWLKRPEILIKIGEPIQLYNYAEVFGNNLEGMASFVREKIIELMDLKEIQLLEDLNSIDSKSFVNVTMYNTPTREAVLEAQDKKDVLGSSLVN